jgi:uncharacterized protein
MTRACCGRPYAEAEACARGADEGVRGAFGVRVACAVVAAALLLGCATPPAARFHSLLPGAAGETRAASAEATSIGWELLPIAIPAQVDRPQLVVRAADDTIVVLEHERWIAPLADEMHAAISERLAQRFGPAHPCASDKPNAKPPARIRIDVQRFDSAPGRYARLFAEWTVATSAATTPALVCRFESERTVGPEMAELPAGHRRAIAALADAIAGTLTEIDAGRPVRCPAVPARRMAE